MEADCVIVADIYSAGQEPIAGASQDDLVAGIKKSGHKNVIKLGSEKDLAQTLKGLIKEGDMIICLGAGTVTYWAAQLAEQLKNCK